MQFKQNSKIKLYTMVKDEDDIIEDWIKYHSYLFGINNLYIVDNFSKDNTYKILLEYEKKGLNLFRHDNYAFKGEIMSNLIKNTQADFYFPIDIDEFIVLYDKDIIYRNLLQNIYSNKDSDNCFFSICKPEITTDKHNIINYFNNIKQEYYHNIIYKCEYIYPKICKLDSNRPCIDFKYGNDPQNYGTHAKVFLNNLTKNIKLDHGNHYPTNKFIHTNIYLLHYHNRGNLNQIKKKTINNLVGLGYDITNSEENITNLKKKISRKIPGNHHIKTLISIYDNKYKINIDKKTGISLQPLINILTATNDKTNNIPD